MEETSKTGAMMLFDREKESAGKNTPERASSAKGGRKSQDDQVADYLSKLKKFHRIRDKWITRGLEKRLKKERRKMLLFVDKDRRSHDVKRRLHGRRHLPSRDLEPGEASAPEFNKTAPSPPAGSKPTERGWADRISSKFLSAFKKKDKI